MLTLTAPVIAGLLLGVCLGGSIAGPAQRGIRWAPLGVLCLALQVALFTPLLDRQPWIVSWGTWLYVGTLAGVCALLVRNGLAMAPRVQRAAWWIASLGVALNILVITVNGGYMPRLNESEPIAAATQLSNVQPITPSTQLVWLSDVLVEPSWVPNANILSIGDLLLSTGVAGWAFAATVSSRRRTATRSRELPQPA
jgi:hypothetical protein